MEFDTEAEGDRLCNFWTRDEATSLTMMTAILQGRMGHALSLTAVNEMSMFTCESKKCIRIF